MPDITAIIAAYNDAGYIAECIESVAAAGAAEIIVVDDASTDETAAVVESMGLGQVRLIRLGHNSGPSTARNTGLREATNDLCAMIDADDLIPPERLRVLADLSERTGSTAVVDDLTAFHDATGEHLWRRLDRIPGDEPSVTLTALDMIRHDLGSLKPLFHRKRLLELGLEYPEDIRRGEDFLLLLGILKKGGSIVATRNTRYLIRRRTTGRLTSDRRALYSQLLTHQLRFQLSHRLSFAEHVALLRRHAGNAAGLLKSILKPRKA